MKNIYKYIKIKNLLWLIFPVLLGLYQSKLNSIQNIIKYEKLDIMEEVLKALLSDIAILKVIGYITFFITLLMYFKLFKKYNKI